MITARNPFARRANPAAHANPATTTGQELLEHARGGDLRAWELVVRQHQELVFRAGLLVTGDAERSGEVAMATFVRAYHALPGLVPATLPRPWLVRIGVAEARSRRREIDRQDRHARQPERMTFPRLAATPGGPAYLGPTMAPSAREALVGSFERLGLDDRLVIASRCLLGLTRDEAAELMGLLPDAVEDRLRAALQRVRASLSDPRVATMPDDQLGTWLMAAAMSRVTWTPDVAAAVIDRLQRDAVAYPEHFDPTSRLVSPLTTRAVDTSSLPGSRPARAPGSGRLPALWAPMGLLAAAAVIVVVVLVPGEGRPSGVGAGGPGGLGALGLGGPAREADGRTVGLDTPMNGVALSILDGGTVSADGDRVPVQVDWSAGSASADDAPVTDVARELQRRIATGNWSTVGALDDAQRSIVTMVPGRRYTFRVRPTGADTATDPGLTWRTRIVLRDSASARLRASGAGSWRLGGAIGGTTLAVTEDDTVSTTFHGRGVGLVAPLHPVGSVLRVRIDDGPWHSEPLQAEEAAVRRVVFSRQLEPGRHTLEVGAEQGTVALDAVLILH